MWRKKGYCMGTVYMYIWLPSSKLTWQWKFAILNRRYIFKWLFFHCHGSFRWNICNMQRTCKHLLRDVMCIFLWKPQAWLNNCQAWCPKLGGTKFRVVNWIRFLFTQIRLIYLVVVSFRYVSPLPGFLRKSSNLACAYFSTAFKPPPRMLPGLGMDTQNHSPHTKQSGG